MRYSHQHGISPPPFGLGPYGAHKLTICWVKGLYRDKCQALGAALRDGIAGVEVPSLQLADHQKLQSVGAPANHQDGFGRGYASLLHRFNNGVNRLDEGGFFKGDIVGKRDDAALGYPGHGFDVFAEAAAVGCEAAGEAGGLVLLALREEAFLTVKAFAAGRVMEAHDAIAGLPFGDAGADSYDGTGEFVTEDLRRLDVALEDFFDVGAANAAGSDFDEDFVIADLGNGDFFDAHDSLFAVDAGAHGFGDGAESGCGLYNRSRATHVAETSVVCFMMSVATRF